MAHFLIRSLHCDSQIAFFPETEEHTVYIYMGESEFTTREIRTIFVEDLIFKEDMLEISLK